LEVQLAAGLKLLETNSWLAYDFASKYKDLVLLSKAREKLLKDAKKLVKSDVSAAFGIAELVKDYGLIAQCGPRLLDEYPEKAYKAGRLVSDQQLMNDAVDRLIQTGLTGNLLHLAEEGHDVNLLRKVADLEKTNDDSSLLQSVLHVALQLCDTEIIEDLGAKVQPAFEALKMGLTFRNKALLKIGGWRVLKEDDPKLSSSMGYAYEAGKILGDKDLMKAVLSKIKDRLSSNVASLVKEHYLGD
jgi:hypothetical protein